MPIIDGWIGKFYPYNKKGQPSTFQPIKNMQDLPAENVQVPFNYLYQPTGEVTPMAFWAGFVGQRQDRATRAMRPEIAWAVVRKDNSIRSEFRGREAIDDLAVKNVTEVPADILRFQRIGTLRLSFLHDIVLPTELSCVQIGTLYLTGHLDSDAEPALLTRFPDTNIYINGVARPHVPTSQVK